MLEEIKEEKATGVAEETVSSAASASAKEPEAIIRRAGK